MTQLSLFDAPATTGSSTLALSASPSTTSPAATGTPWVVASPVAESPVPVAEQARTATKAPPHREGLNHMGDLAKLVLLRYELAAKRRADAAKRRHAR